MDISVLASRDRFPQRLIRPSGDVLILNAALAEALSAVLLLAVLGCAVVRPWGWPEAVVAVPAAILVIGIGAISLRDASAGPPDWGR